MVKLFKLNQQLIQKKFYMKKATDILKFYGLILVILVGLKYLTTLPPKPVVFKELFGLFLGFMGVFQIRRDSISKNQLQIQTFFPTFHRDTIKNYFKYQKPVFVYLTILYLLFPLNISPEEIQHFFFFLAVLMGMMFIDTLGGRLFDHSKWADRIYVAIRIGYFILFSPSLADRIWGTDLPTVIMNQQLGYLIIISLFFAVINPLILTAPNRVGETIE